MVRWDMDWSTRMTALSLSPMFDVIVCNDFRYTIDDMIIFPLSH